MPVRRKARSRMRRARRATMALMAPSVVLKMVLKARSAVVAVAQPTAQQTAAKALTTADFPRATAHLPPRRRWRPRREHSGKISMPHLSALSASTPRPRRTRTHPSRHLPRHPPTHPPTHPPLSTARNRWTKRRATPPPHRPPHPRPIHRHRPPRPVRAPTARRPVMLARSPPTPTPTPTRAKPARWPDCSRALRLSSARNKVHNKVRSRVRSKVRSKVRNKPRNPTQLPADWPRSRVPSLARAWPSA